MLIQTLPNPEYTEEEQNQVIEYVLQQRKDQIRGFLRDSGVRISGNKEDLRERIIKALKRKALSYTDLIAFIDRTEPWGKQHVFLYEGPDNSLNDWRTRTYVEALLKKNRVHKYLGKKLPLILPPELKLSSIEHSGDILRITAIRRYESLEREEGLDEARTDDGRKVELRAFVRVVSRGIVTFEWNLATNHAMLQVSQLPKRIKYEDARNEFADMVEHWLSLSHFQPIELGRAIKKLHTESKNSPHEIRAHVIEYLSLGGRKIEGRSASSETPLLGEVVVDAALDGMNQHGTGNEGNFYFLQNGSASNPIPSDEEIHVLVMASKGRVNFTTPNGEEIVRYVIGRIRNASQ